ncbi:unnamed protein product [Tilletia controversa]|nr:unnamed protein product [Tilletia controversa]
MNNDQAADGMAAAYSSQPPPASFAGSGGTGPGRTQRTLFSHFADQDNDRLRPAFFSSNIDTRPLDPRTASPTGFDFDEAQTPSRFPPFLHAHQHLSPGLQPHHHMSQVDNFTLESGQSASPSDDASTGHSSSQSQSGRSSVRRSAKVDVPRPPNAWILYRSAKVAELRGNLGSTTALETPGCSNAAADSSLSRSPSKTKYEPTMQPSDALPTAPPTLTVTGKHLSPQAEMSKNLGELWRTEPKEVKDFYYELAEKKRAEHEATHPGYKYKPRKTEKSVAARMARRKTFRLMTGSDLPESSASAAAAAAAAAAGGSPLLDGPVSVAGARPRRRITRSKTDVGVLRFNSEGTSSSSRNAPRPYPPSSPRPSRLVLLKALSPSKGPSYPFLTTAMEGASQHCPDTDTSTPGEQQQQQQQLEHLMSTPLSSYAGARPGLGITLKETSQSPSRLVSSERNVESSHRQDHASEELMEAPVLASQARPLNPSIGQSQAGQPRAGPVYEPHPHTFFPPLPPFNDTTFQASQPMQGSSQTLSQVPAYSGAMYTPSTPPFTDDGFPPHQGMPSMLQSSPLTGAMEASSRLQVATSLPTGFVDIEPTLLLPSVSQSSSTEQFAAHSMRPLYDWMDQGNNPVDSTVQMAQHQLQQQAFQHAQQQAYGQGAAAAAPLTRATSNEMWMHPTSSADAAAASSTTRNTNEAWIHPPSNAPLPAGLGMSMEEYDLATLLLGSSISAEQAAANIANSAPDQSLMFHQEPNMMSGLTGDNIEGDNPSSSLGLLPGRRTPSLSNANTNTNNNINTYLNTNPHQSNIKPTRLNNKIIIIKNDNHQYLDTTPNNLFAHGGVASRDNLLRSPSPVSPLPPR